jgi:hypothetical protein
MKLKNSIFSFPKRNLSTFFLEPKSKWFGCYLNLNIINESYYFKLLPNSFFYAIYNFLFLLIIFIINHYAYDKNTRNIQKIWKSPST